MCEQCGCGLPGEKPVVISKAHHRHDENEANHPAHSHRHKSEHEQEQEHAHSHEEVGAPEDEPWHYHSSGERQTLELGRSILDKNNRLAERNRGFFHARGLLVLNLLSAPGSGKTLLASETIGRLAGRLKTAVIVGDLATDNDARRMRQTGAPVIQINTGTVCHLDAEMVARSIQRLDLQGLELLLIENVGNLVCPASYDLGEDLRVVLLSVADGEDKPLKYPPLFHSANVVIITKSDLSAACDFDRDRAISNIRHIAPQAELFETSAKTGAGMDLWCDYLVRQHQRAKQRDPLLDSP